MRIVWAPSAQRRLEEIVSFIAADRQAASERVLEQPVEAARTLGEHPHLGRRGCLLGTRELAVAGTPYLIIYRVRGDLPVVLTIFDSHHTRGRLKS